jgi:hypothetical protein
MFAYKKTTACASCGRHETTRFCLICRRQEANPVYGGQTLGYGSDFDGLWVCGECTDAVLDPAIVAARKARGFPGTLGEEPRDPAESSACPTPPS